MTGEARAIGVWGTVARVAVGALLVGSVVYGHASRGSHPAAWLLGRDDQIGCAPFGPIDTAEARHAGRRPRVAAGGRPMNVELLLAPDCPNASAAGAVLAECIDRLGLDLTVREQAGNYPSPTILVDGVDVMTGRPGAPPVQACRLDVPTADRVLAALKGHRAPSTLEDAA